MKNRALNQLKMAFPTKTFSYGLYIFSVIMQSALTVLFALAVKSFINSVEVVADKKVVLTRGIVLICLVVFMLVFGALASFLSAKLSVKAEISLKNFVFSRFIGDYENSSRYMVGDVVSRFESDVITVSSTAVNLLPSIISTAVKLIGTIVALFLLQPLFTLIILGCSLIVALVSVILRKTVSRLHKAEMKAHAKSVTALNELSKNTLLINVNGATQYAKSKYQTELEQLKKSKLKKRYFTAFLSVAVSVFFTLFYVFAVVYGVYGIFKGFDGFSFGMITAIMQLVLQIRTPVTSVSGYFTAYAEMVVSAERLVELTSTTASKTEITEFSSLTLNGVTFAYGETPVLQGVDLTVNKGDKILIKGASGIGKTTLIKVLTGAYTNYGGSVLLNGTKTKPSSVSGLFGFVPQGNSLIPASVKENVVFGNEYDDKRLENAINTSGLSETISSLPNGVDTVIGENGFALSEGQAQRVAIARAVYLGAPVLVLDEPTSALDNEISKTAISNIIKNDNLTVIIISHDDMVENYVAKVYTLSGGKLI